MIDRRELGHDGAMAPPTDPAAPLGAAAPAALADLRLHDTRRRSIERFEPSDEEVEAARERAAAEPQGPETLHIRLDAAASAVPATIIDDLKHVLGNHAGESEVVLGITTSAGERTLRFGEEFRVAPTPSLRAELEHILGPSALRAGAA